ncbi:MAG: sigma-70 family RNA polymerase sigma factor [Acutalibacteraceae bacterium]
MRIANEILMYFRNSKKSSLDISINEPIETDKNGNILTLMDTISVDDSIADKIDTKINIQKLGKYILKGLSTREKIILCLRYGIGGKKPLPQREVASVLGISRSYVSRIEKKALQTLKKMF